MKYAPTASAISRNFAKSIAREYALAPATINFGFTAFAFQEQHHNQAVLFLFLHHILQIIQFTTEIHWATVC